jgi:predicted amidophosphoribosyltransferase
MNLLLGPAGVVTMLGLYERPAREVCSGCGRKRFVIRRECPYCNAPLQPIALDGREIFEPEDAFQTVG